MTNIFDRISHSIKKDKSMDANDIANAAQVPQIQVVVTFDPTTGSVNLNGPLENSILVYGLLEMGKNAYNTWLQNKQNESRITPVSIMPGFPPRG